MKSWGSKRGGGGRPGPLVLHRSCVPPRPGPASRPGGAGPPSVRRSPGHPCCARCRAPHRVSRHLVASRVNIARHRAGEVAVLCAAKPAPTKQWTGIIGRQWGVNRRAGSCVDRQTRAGRREWQQGGHGGGAASFRGVAPRPVVPVPPASSPGGGHTTTVFVLVVLRHLVDHQIVGARIHRVVMAAQHPTEQSGGRGGGRVRARRRRATARAGATTPAGRRKAARPWLCIVRLRSCSAL